jgi:hypothetical protein
MQYRRLIKQTIYGLLYLLIITGIGYLFYIIALKPAPSCFDNKQNQEEEEIDCGGPCQTCATRYLDDIQAQRALLIDSPIDGESILIFQIENPNAHFGAESLNYKVSLYPDKVDGTPVLLQFQADSYVYPAELKTVIYLGVGADSEDVRRIDIDIVDVQWLPREEYSRPETIVRSVETELRDEGSLRPKLAIIGVVRNENAYDLSSVDLSVQISGAFGRVSIASKASIGAIEGFSDKDFEIIIPLRPNQILDLGAKPRITVEARK